MNQYTKGNGWLQLSMAVLQWIAVCCSVLQCQHALAMATSNRGGKGKGEEQTKTKSVMKEYTTGDDRLELSCGERERACVCVHVRESKNTNMCTCTYM